MKNEWIQLIGKSAQAMALAVALFFVLLGVITALLLYTPISESRIFFYGMAAACLSGFMAGIQQGLLVGKRGMLIGIAAGAIAFLCIILLCMLLGTGGILLCSFRPIQLLPALLGGIGGIIGANLKK